AQPDTGTMSGRRLDNKLAATPSGSLLHDGHTEVVGAAGDFLGKPLAVVADFDLHVAGRSLDFNSYSLRLSMAPHVRQCFADDMQPPRLGSRFRVPLIEYEEFDRNRRELAERVRTGPHLWEKVLLGPRRLHAVAQHFAPLRA